MSGRRSPRRAAALWLLLIGGTVAAADQGAKWLVLRYLPPGESLPVLGSVMSLTRTVNPGALFGMFASAGWWLAAAGAALTAGLLLWGLLAGWRHPRFLLPVGLLLGGAVGNLIDRVAHGHVVDFLDFHFWPVFNLADIALTCGAALAVWRVLWPSPPPARG